MWNQKCKSFTINIILHNTDPNAYWILLKNLQDDKQFDQFENIRSEQWVNHFSID